METVDPANSGRPERTEVRRYQFSLRGLLALTGIAAGFFSVACILGYVDAAISLVALMVLFRVLLRPRPVRRTTAVLLTLVAGLMLWANLRPTGWQGEFGLATPTGLDAITGAMFWRGWPLSPCMVCLIHGMKLHPSGSQWVLVLDSAIFAICLFAAKAVCERCLHWRDRRMRVGGAAGRTQRMP
jgi:hypothetical protein